MEANMHHKEDCLATQEPSKAERNHQQVLYFINVGKLDCAGFRESWSVAKLLSPFSLSHRLVRFLVVHFRFCLKRLLKFVETIY